MPNTASVEAKPVSLARPAEGELQVQLRGRWKLQETPSEAVLQSVHSELQNLQRLSFDSRALQGWDSSLLIFLRKLIARAEAEHVDIDLAGLPAGVQRLLALASSSPQKPDRNLPPAQRGPLRHLGVAVLYLWHDVRGSLHFVGENALSLIRMVRGRAQFNRDDLWPMIQDCGPRALPIVTLISFLVGTILAYMGAVQLQQFGAQIFIADLVGLGMAREMGAIMTGVVVAGRSGAAFAAQLGTMQVNEEIDAIQTMGISPIDYLVLPRMLALILMVPLLTLYADVLGIVGGMLVATALMDLHPLQYFAQTVDALSIADFVAGLIKAALYGVLIAIAGCMRGMQCGRSAEAVGRATTSAVVTSIIYMVVAAALLAVVFHEVGL